MENRELKTTIGYVIEHIVGKLKQSSDELIFTTLLDAYNRYQENERDSVDYIFNLNKKDDVMVMLEGGLELNDLSYLLNGQKQYLLFGANHPLPTQLSKDDVKTAIFAHLYDIVQNVIAYPFIEEYRDIYEEFITTNAL